MLGIGVKINDLIKICLNLGIIPNSLNSLTILFNFEMQAYDFKIVAFNLKQRKAYVVIQ